VSEIVVGRTLADLERTGDLSDTARAAHRLTLCAALSTAHAARASSIASQRRTSSAQSAFEE